MKKLLIILAVGVLLGAGVFVYVSYLQNLKHYTPPLTDQTDWKMYKNEKYGFEMVFPESWKGYSVTEKTWTGNKLEESGTITGPLVVFRNPNWTEEQHWQDIPIMVFTKDVWQLVEQEKISLGAAPIGPAKIGENSTYVFATPARWYGFTDDIGWQEAVEIVKTFNAL